MLNSSEIQENYSKTLLSTASIEKLLGHPTPLLQAVKLATNRSTIAIGINFFLFIFDK